MEDDQAVADFVYEEEESMDAATLAVETLARTLGVACEVALGALLKCNWSPSDAATAISDGFSVVPARVASTRSCSVCFDDDAVVLGTTLCSHEACAACWRTHIDRVSGRVKELHCFGAQESGAACCGKVISVAVAVTGVELLPLPDAVKRDYDSSLRQVAALVCSKCDLPLTVLDGTKAVCLKCASDAVCVHCRRAHHPPATCASMQQWDVLVAQHEALLTSRYCKPCPRCHQVIERIAGCDFIHHEVCGEKFCWKCLEPWSDGAKHLFCAAAVPATAEVFVACNDSVRQYILKQNVTFATELDRTEVTADAVNSLLNSAVPENDVKCINVVLRAVAFLKDVYWLLACACIDMYFYRASVDKLRQLDSFSKEVATFNEFLTLVPAQVRSVPDTIPEVACTIHRSLMELDRLRHDLFSHV